MDTTEQLTHQNGSSKQGLTHTRFSPPQAFFHQFTKARNKGSTRGASEVSSETGHGRRLCKVTSARGPTAFLLRLQTHWCQWLHIPTPHQAHFQAELGNFKDIFSFYQRCLRNTSTHTESENYKEDPMAWTPRGQVNIEGRGLPWWSRG